MQNTAKSYILKDVYVEYLIRERFSLNVNIIFNIFLYLDRKNIPFLAL